MSILKNKLHNYKPLIKPLQTGLLLITGLAGYMSARCPVANWQMLLSLLGSLFLAISGSTALNMWYDRDIDAKMRRTDQRPLPSGSVQPSEALIFGLSLSALGVSWAYALSLNYGLVILAGLFFDVIVYTIWLKRRTPWSIIWGGISGGMPVLAGRVLGIGGFDWIGITLSLGVLLWIPTHIMTFNMRYFDDYKNALIPTFPSQYGFQKTRTIIAISSMMAAIAMSLGAYGIGMTIGYLRILAVLSIGLFGFAFSSAAKPSMRLNFGLYKFASVYMLISMLLIIFDSGEISF